jgi:hypothetical protein
MGFTVRMSFPPLLKRLRCPAGGKGRLDGGGEDCPFREGVAGTGWTRKRHIRGAFLCPPRHPMS